MKRNIDWNDKDARRAYDREYYASKKKEKKEYFKKWQKENEESVKEYRKQYYKKHYVPKVKERKEPHSDNVFEIWKDINEDYCVSNYGRVWSRLSNKFIGHKNGMGYIEINIGERYYLVHRLVADAFVPNPNNYPEVDHIDTDKTNNVWTNLRWTDRKGNQNNPITVEKFKSIGQSNFGDEGDASKAVRQYSLDGKLIAEYSSIIEAAEKLGIGRIGIGNTCHHRQHTTGGFRWEFAENVLNDCNIAS